MSTPRRPRASLRLPLAMEDRIEALCAREHISFSAAMRIALNIGLQLLEQARACPTAQMVEQAKQPPSPPVPQRRRGVLSKGVGY